MRRLLVLFALFALALAAEVPESSAINNSYVRALKVMTAAEKGDAAARFDVGMLHEKGDVVPQNHKEAMKWFLLSAEGGYAPAQLFVGLLYASGKGVPKDSNEALKWIRLAADQGNPEAQFYLGGVYFGDRVVPHDYVQAYKWFRLASPKDNDAGANALQAVARFMTAEQVSEAERLAASWKPANPR